MTTRSNHHHRDARLLFATWVFLLALTAGSFWIADLDSATPFATPSAAGTATAAIVLGIAALKAHLIAGVFMEMLQAPRAWAIAMSVFLISLAGTLVALF